MGLFSSQLFSQSNNNSGLRLSLRAGYDLPFFNNNTPYIDYKGGLEAGASLDYYWNWFGIGADFDYINNKPQSTYPTTNLMIGSTPLTNFTLSENKITRMFYGIGPSFRFLKKPTSDFEFKLRGGLSTIKGGKTELFGVVPPATLLNFHAGYDLKNSLAAKASLQFNKFFSNNWGFHLGAYYLQHFDGTELVDATQGISAGYMPFTNEQDMNFVNPQSGLSVREEACNCEIHSIGVYAGLVYKFGAKEKKVEVCEVCGKDHYPRCCKTCGCTITITAKDKFTNTLLEDTDVILLDDKGNVAQSATTNSYGVVVFNNVPSGNYTVKGKLNDINLEQSSISTNEFKNCQVDGKSIQKEILYTDENFIVKGKVVICNTNSAVNGVSVVLKNNNLGVQKSTNTNDKGEFIFHALQNANYSIYGKKENYMSQTEIVSTKDYDRNKTLFIKLEICLDPADCGKAITLKNIHYDLDKYFIREDAKPELNRLVQFLQDNPNVKVELSSHTDCRASNKYNQTLSQNRATAAVQYVVSQGISKDRITGVGYGETKLLNRCADGVKCSEDEHQVNRRTEVKVICPK